MYYPKVYEAFTGNYPEVAKAYQAYGKACREAGPLDAKTQDLIKLGISAGANSRGAVMSSVRKALTSGAVAEEINHAIVLSASTTGFPGMIAALGWAGEVLNRQAD